MAGLFYFNAFLMDNIVDIHAWKIFFIIYSSIHYSEIYI